MQLLRNAFDVVEPVYSYDDFDSLEPLLQCSDPFLDARLR
jgi:hypothetical protein